MALPRKLAVVFSASIILTGHAWAPRLVWHVPCAVTSPRSSESLRPPLQQWQPLSAGPFDEDDDDDYAGMTEEEKQQYIIKNALELNEETRSLLPEIDVDEVLAEEERSRDPSVMGQDFGDMNGLDDPRDAPWRLKAEELVRSAVAAVPGVDLYDIAWNIGDLCVQVEPEGGGAEAEPVSLDKIVAVNQAIIEALDPVDDELEVLSRHEVEVSSKGAPEVLTAEREFVAFKGYDVTVETKSIGDGVEAREPIEGRLVGRDVHNTIISVKGRNVKIPNYLVTAVRLPPALEEKGEFAPTKTTKKSRK